MLMGEFRPGTEKELRKQDEKERVAAQRFVCHNTCLKDQHQNEQEKPTDMLLVTLSPGDRKPLQHVEIGLQSWLCAGGPTMLIHTYSHATPPETNQCCQERNFERSALVSPILVGCWLV